MSEETKRAILRVQATLERSMRAIEGGQPDIAWCEIRQAQISLARLLRFPTLLKQHDMRCMHDVEIGKRCKACRGIVGGKGPKPGPGQVWRGRGVGHPYLIMDEPTEVCGVFMVELFSIDHTSLENSERIGESRRGVRWGVTDLADEFWYWGSPAEGAERVAS